MSLIWEEQGFFPFFRIEKQESGKTKREKEIKKYVLFPFSIKHFLSLSLIILENIHKNSYTVI